MDPIQDTLAYVAIGAVIGTSAGLSPGPLSALIVSQAMHHGVAAGRAVALAPLVTDIPIILATLSLLSQIADVNPWMGTLSMLGGVIVCLFGWQDLRPKRDSAASAPASVSRPLRKGILVNALSPHPYLFWLTVGGPLTVQAAAVHSASAAGFLSAFYLSLVGAKMLIAEAAARSRRWLGSKGHKLVLRALGALLILLGIRMTWHGVQLLTAA